MKINNIKIKKVNYTEDRLPIDYEISYKGQLYYKYSSKYGNGIMVNDNQYHIIPREENTDFYKAIKLIDNKEI